MTDQLDLDGLERLAKAATPGEWCVDPRSNCDVATVDGNEIASTHEGLLTGGYRDPEFSQPDAAYIAAANPATILALISQAREAERMRGALERQADNMAFVLNHFPIVHHWYEKFTVELDADRQALAPATGGGE